jgi:Tol biopolymer transport system component
VPLTTTGKASRPALSPDGKYVVYVLQDGNEWSLWLRQTDTESNVRILAPEAGVLLLGATITPDGTFVDYVRSAPGTPRELWRIPLLGGAPRKLISGMQSLVSWSPDNRRMAFLRQVGTDTDLALITADADLGNERVLASRSGKATFISFFSLGVPVNGPAWSPDGRLLAFAGAEAGPGGLRVVIVDAASGGERTLGFEAAGIHGLGWISSTEVVAVATELNEAPSAQVWRLSVTDGGRERMTTDISAYEGLSISADRRSVVTARMDTRLSLWVGDPAGRTGRDVEPTLYWPTTAIINATVSWAGDRLLFTQFVRGRPSVVALAPNGTRATVVDDAYDGYGTPDGRSILFVRLGNDAVWRRDIDGRDSERLFDKGRVEDVSANNQDVAFVSVASGVQAPWIVSLADGKPHQLADMFAAGRSIAVSPDGRRVAFVTREPDGRRLIVCGLWTDRRTIS